MKSDISAEKSAQILIIDDEEAIRDSCHQILERRGYSVTSTGDALDGLQTALENTYDLILLDIRMPKIGGLEILKCLKVDHASNSEIIIMTAYGTIQLAVEAMRYGANNVLTKPFSAKELTESVAKALGKSGSFLHGDDISELVGDSDYMQDLRETIRRVARTDSTVLITGESGTGKELVARAIQKLSSRRDKPFISVDCSSLVESLMESELFGYKEGAFSGASKSRNGRFQMADSGTLFLDEISNISMNTQMKLLRVLQEQEVPRVGSPIPEKVDVRLIAATNKNLKREIEEGHFREDLFYRLSVVPIDIKPLREHRHDVLPIAMYYLHFFRQKHKSKVKRLSEESKKSLTSYTWPGNIRELKNTIERLCVLCENEVVTLSDLLYFGRDGEVMAPVIDSYSKSMTLVDVERAHIEKALKHFNFQIGRTASFLGINRKTLRTKIRNYNIKVE